MAGRFYFGDDSIPDTIIPAPLSDDEDTTSLPFPKPLARPSFLTPTFDPHTFLSSLSSSNRFQSLEDLQTELRELSAQINKELVDLVNENYEEFVHLGAELRGGEEKIEEVRVGLLGFEKDIIGLRDKVIARSEEVKALVEQKRDVKREIGVGRGLLEIDERLVEMEYRLGLKKKEERRRKSVIEQQGQGDDENEWSEDWDEDSMDDSEEEDGAGGSAIFERINALVEKYLIVKTLLRRYDQGHPFLVAQKERIHRVQDQVRLEVETAIRGSDELSFKQKLIQIRTKMDE